MTYLVIFAYPGAIRALNQPQEPVTKPSYQAHSLIMAHFWPEIEDFKIGQNLHFCLKNLYKNLRFILSAWFSVYLLLNGSAIDVESSF